MRSRHCPCSLQRALPFPFSRFSQRGIALRIRAGLSQGTGKVERLASNGETKVVAKALQLVRDYNASHEKPAISDRHKFWELGGAVKAAVEKVEAAASEPETIAKGEGVEIVADRAADRVKIVFAAKPDVQMIGKLTEAAKYSARRITGLG